MDHAAVVLVGCRFSYALLYLIYRYSYLLLLCLLPSLRPSSSFLPCRSSLDRITLEMKCRVYRWQSVPPTKLSRRSFSSFCVLVLCLLCRDSSRNTPPHGSRANYAEKVHCGHRYRTAGTIANTNRPPVFWLSAARIMPPGVVDRTGEAGRAV